MKIRPVRLIAAGAVVSLLVLGSGPASTPTRNAIADPTPIHLSDATAAPTATPVPGTVTVSSIAALLTALADNSVDEIVVADGTYHVSSASMDHADSLSMDHADSLWIGAAYAKRTQPVTVRAATQGGVTFDGGGAASFGCLSFEAGAHDQTWDGFRCANGRANETGVITFGGYPGLAAPNHITMNNITIMSSCTGSATSASAPATDHAFYVSEAVGGPHDLVFNDVTVDGRGGLASAFQFYHSDAANQNGWNITVRRLHVIGTQEAIILWDPTLRAITFDTVDVSGALRYAVRYEQGTGITLTDITSTGSGSGQGFYSSQGATPAGVTFSGDSFH